MTAKSVELQALRRSTRRILGITVLLTQAPLVFHLPLWISIPGMLLVLSKVLPTFDKKNLISPLMMTPLVLLAAAAIVFHYGQFFDRDPCVTFLFLLVGFKFAESRRIYDASLVIILCAFLLMTQFFYWQTLAAAMLSIPAIFYIGLSFFSLQRGSAELDRRTMVNITSRLLLQAIPVAMFLFVAIPRITTPGLGEGNNGNSLTGLSARMSPGSIAQLSKSSAVAFRVEFDSQSPLPSELYWRGPVLSGYDGSEWFILPTQISNYVQQTNYSNDSQVKYTVTMEPTQNPWLLALDTPTSLPQKIHRNGDSETIAHINRERQLNSHIPLDRVTRYTTTSALTDRFTPSSQPSAEYLLTTESNPLARTWAMQLRSRFADDETLIREILRSFNTQDFFYTLNPPRLGKHSIDEFLFDSKRGFCEHYAGSFVFLLRAAGIPARVVTGYQGGELNNSYMIVRQSDAHAWTEAFIDGQWRRFDPTAAVAPQRIEGGISEALRAEQSSGLLSQFDPNWLKAAKLKWDSINYAWQHIVIGFDSSSQNAMWEKLGIERPGALTIVLIILAAAALWMSAILFPSVAFSQPKSDPCEKQWQQLCRRFAKKGLGRNKGETPEAYIGRLIAQLPNQQQHLTALLRAYQTGRFSRQGQQRNLHLQQARMMKEASQHISLT